MNLESRHCPLCGPETPKTVKYPPNFSEGDLNAEIFSARRTPDRRHFQLVECTGCGVIYSDPACDPSLLSKLYLESSVNYDKQEQQIYDSYAPILDRAMKLVRNKGTFVELGGGRGFMLRYGAERGFIQQVEIEPSQDAETKFTPPTPQARFIRGIFTEGTLPKNSASLICFFQMLDHVPNPLQFLKDVYEALEPGGVAVCVTHNTSAFSAKVLGERSPIYDVEHTYLFNPRNMSRFFGRVGFQNLDAFPISNNYAIRHWFNLAPLPKPAKAKLLPVLEGMKLADVRIPLRAGNFGMIGQKPF